jgi:hypothetical protein
MTEISIQNNVISENYNKVLDTEFKTFVVGTPSDLTQITLDQFFQYYDDLFYQIPKEGDINSHNYILNKTIEYLGVRLADDVAIQALLEEITRLRRQILQDNQTIAGIAKIS